MSKPELVQPASAVSFEKGPSQVRRSTSPGILETNGKPGEVNPDTDEKITLENIDCEISYREAARNMANRRLRYDLTLLSCIFIMLLWPWILLGIIYSAKGIQMNKHLAKIVINHPHSINFFVTLFASVVCLLIDIIFSFAVIRFSQEWIANSDNITVFDVSVISGLRHQTLPWNVKEIKQLLVGNRVAPVSLVAICIGAFALIPSGITSLITPVPFKKNVTLHGVELDFSSSAADCLDWLENIKKPDCNFGTNNIGCFANQLVDVLDSGRGNILSVISNNSQSVSFGQLGGSDGLRFLGPIRGVLPLGPNGVPAFDILPPSPFSNNNTVAGMISYNYSLDHQGVTSGINCNYANASPIRFGAVPGVSVPWVLQYNASCDTVAQVDALTDVVTFISVNANNTLGSWACKSPPAAGQMPTYFIYFRGRGAMPGGYQDSIGNITCTISPFQAAIYPVTYQSVPRIFSSMKPIANSTQVHSRLMEGSLLELAQVLHLGQNFQANIVAESVLTFGAKSFGLRLDKKDPRHLELYQWMIQGILEYEATYLRLIWSMADNRPESCNRKVNGSVSYMVLGWSAVHAQVGFLMPMTFLNISALIIIIMAMVVARGDAHEYDPASVRYLLATQVDDTDELEWTNAVRYRRGDYQAVDVALRHRRFA